MSLSHQHKESGDVLDWQLVGRYLHSMPALHDAGDPASVLVSTYLLGWSHDPRLYIDGPNWPEKPFQKSLVVQKI